MPGSEILRIPTAPNNVGTINDGLPGRYLPARRVNPDPIGLLFVTGW